VKRFFENMFELAGALIIGFVTLQGIKLLLARGIVLGSRRREPESPKRRPVYQRWTRTEQESQSQRQPEKEREAEIWRQQREWAAKQKQSEQSEENEWWSVLEVSPDASADEVRRSYLRKIKQSHPDRVAWLAPEFLPWAERRSKMLNAAYTQATRARRGK
jgi:molecular chaperone GrpE (heat shock protein)